MSYSPNSTISRTAHWNKSRIAAKAYERQQARLRVAAVLAAHVKPTEPTAHARKAAAAARDMLRRHAKGRVGWEYVAMPPGIHDGKGGERAAMISNDLKRTLLLTADALGILRDATGRAFGSSLQAAFFCVRMK